jgi:hypothetical protein
VPFVVEGDEEEESDEAIAYNEYDVASKFIRVFTQEEEKYFCIFVELGVDDRTVQLTITNENTEVAVIPPPDGQLDCTLQGDVDETFEIFYFRPSKHLSGECEEILYPAIDPTWIIFKYSLAEEHHQAPITRNLKVAKK